MLNARTAALAAAMTLILSSFSGPAFGANPDTSVNFLGLYRKGTQGSNGFSFQESELHFSSDVDPYLRAVALFAVAPIEGGAEGTPEFALEPEEVYLETLSLPAWTLKAGKFKAALGRHNVTHTHAFAFIDAPLVSEELLGEEGLNDVGVSASVLLPAPWFLELTTQALGGDRDIPAGVAQLKSLWDLSSESTLELNAFGTAAQASEERRSHVLGADLTFKWRPSVGGKYRALIWTGQWLRDNAPGAEEHAGGIASWLQYQFAERWWIQGRMDAFEDSSRQSALLGFFPSEFSGFRLQYDRRTGTDAPTEHVARLQWIISIGAHPAHAY